MHLLVRGLSWGLTALTALTFSLALLLADTRPIASPTAPPTAAERAWVRGWIAQNRPSANPSEGINRVALTEREANLIARALLERIGEGGVDVRLGVGEARIAVSLKLPTQLAETYANVELHLVQADAALRLESVHMAGLPVPQSLVRALAQRAIGAVQRAHVVQSIRLAPGRAELAYTWRPQMLDHIGSSFVSARDLPRLLHYQRHVDRVTAALPRRQSIKLTDLLSSVLSEAAQDTDAPPADANRAALLALAAYVNGRSFHDPAEQNRAAKPRPRPVSLRGRRDLAQHFIASAAIALEGSNALSSLVGWYKELADSNGGSGFSFADMTANRAGTRFALLATSNPGSARMLQRAASRGLSEDDIIPGVADLPEGMTRAQLVRLLGEGRGYQRVLSAIDRQIDASPLYRSAPG